MGAARVSPLPFRPPCGPGAELTDPRRAERRTGPAEGRRQRRPPARPGRRRPGRPSPAPPPGRARRSPMSFSLTLRGKLAIYGTALRTGLGPATEREGPPLAGEAGTGTKWRRWRGV